MPFSIFLVLFPLIFFLRCFLASNSKTTKLILLDSLLLSRFPANSARRVRSLSVIYLNTTSGSFKDTRFQVPVVRI